MNKVSYDLISINPARVKKKLISSASLLFLVLITGTTGYMIIEGWDIFDSLYKTIIKEGDTLIALGEVGKLKILEKKAVS